MMRSMSHVACFKLNVSCGVTAVAFVKFVVVVGYCLRGCCSAKKCTRLVKQVVDLQPCKF
jgi:hypothetical protein